MGEALLVHCTQVTRPAPPRPIGYQYFYFLGKLASIVVLDTRAK